MIDSTGNKEVYLEALECVVSKRYSKRMYNIGGYQESAICLQLDTEGWSVYNGERGNRYDEVKCENILDACLEFIRRFTHEKDEIGIMENELYKIVFTK